MKKITLDLDNITVDSFTVGMVSGVGTVPGYDVGTQVQSCKVIHGGDSNWDLTCEPGLTNDEWTCYWTCGETCEHTCDACCRYTVGAGYPDCSSSCVE